MTEPIVDEKTDILPTRRPDRVACWTTGSGPDQTATWPTGSTCTGCPCDVRG